LPVNGEDRSTVVRLASDALGEVPIRMVALVGDLDDVQAHASGTPASEAWRAEVEPRLNATGLAWYRTRGGARVVAALAEPFSIADREDAAAWSARHVAWCDELHEQHGLVLDDHTHDWTRLFRLPNVVRDGELQRAELHGELRPVALPPPRAPVEAPHAASPAAPAPDRADAGTATYAAANAILAALGDCRDWQGSRHAICGAVGGMLRKALWSRNDCAALIQQWLDVGDPAIKVQPGIDWACKAWDRPAELVSGRQALDAIVGPALGGVVEASALLPWRSKAGAPPEAELVGADAAHENTAVASGWCIMRMADPEEPIDWRCHGLRLATSKGKISLIAGQPGAGKGPLASYLSICLATGTPAFGQHACEAAPTLLLDWEGARLTMRRLRRMARGLGLDPLELDDCLTVVDASGVRDPLSPVWLQQLHDEIARTGARHLVLDSYTSAMLGLDVEPNSAQYARLAQALGELDALVLAVAHANKAAAASAKPGLHHVSGTGALSALAQTAILAHRPDEDDEHRIRLSCARGPEGRFDAFDARFTDRDDGALVLTAEQVEQPAQRGTADPPAKRAPDDGHAVVTAGQRALRVLRDEPHSHVYAELERRSGEGPRAVRQALARLEDAGLAECAGGQYSATERGYDASDDAVARALGVVGQFTR
jgi:DNA-binding transcriptional ArsR family regulator